jgi:hypothetical protein
MEAIDPSPLIPYVIQLSRYIEPVIPVLIVLLLIWTVRNFQEALSAKRGNMDLNFEQLIEAQRVILEVERKRKKEELFYEDDEQAEM